MGSSLFVSSHFGKSFFIKIFEIQSFDNALNPH